MWRPSTCGGHMLAVVRVICRREEQSHPNTSSDVDRTEDALSLRESTEEQQVVVGLFAERQPVGLDAVQDDSSDVESREQARLFLRDGDERGFRVSLPQRDLGRSWRVMQCLDDWRRRQSREGQRHRVVTGFVVDDVELARAFHRGGDVQHLVHLPRPHGLVVPIAVRIRGVQRCRRL